MPRAVESIGMQHGDYGAVVLTFSNNNDFQTYLLTNEQRLQLIRQLSNGLLPTHTDKPICHEAPSAAPMPGAARTFAVGVDEVLPTRTFAGPGPTLLDFKQQYLMTPPELRVDLAGNEAIVVAPAVVGAGYLLDSRGIKLTIIQLGREGERARSVDLELARGMGLHLMGAMQTVLHF